MTQTSSKCSKTFRCSAETSFKCVDHNLELSPDTTWFYISTLAVRGYRGYPEFLDMVTVSTIYRPQMLVTSIWGRFADKKLKA